MSSRRSRFVTLCQQLLVLGVICAALTPAATVINLDIVPGGREESPGAQAAAGSGRADGAGVPASMAAYVAATRRPSRVPTAVVAPTVREVRLTAPVGGRVASGGLSARSVLPRRGGGTQVLSRPQHVSGYGAVGVTWAHGEQVAEDDITVRVRTRSHEHWSGWQTMAYHDDHGPDVGSAEAAQARPGTDEMVVGDVGEVQVRIATTHAAPADLKLAVIDPGEPVHTAMERPALDTAALGGAAAAPAVLERPGAGGDRATAPVSGQVALARAVYTPKPQIYSRAQWGADESMRDKASLHYYEVHAGFVHHTATANGYSRSQVPAIIRSIYAYHTRSKGWSDIGYNFLVDRFGRIWEGRYGGVDRAVVGAHTLGYNDDSFAASAIGNYEEVQPSQAMIEAYGALFAWKLSLHGVDASSGRQYVTSRNFRAINGHRDAGQTACPGRYLYARLPEIRALAARTQRGWSGRQLESDLARTASPDIIVRRHSDGEAMVIPLLRRRDGTFRAGRAIDTGQNVVGADRIMDAGDWNRDGHPDMIARSAATGWIYLYRGDGTGRLSAPTLLSKVFRGVGLLAAVGDMTGDGWPDLMGQPGSGAMRIYPGRGATGLKRSFVAFSHLSGTRQVGVGRWDADGAPDSLFRRGSALFLRRGNGPGGLTGRPRNLGMDVSHYDWTIGISDVGGAPGGHPDLVMRSHGDGRLWLVQGSGGALAAPVLLGTGMTAYDMSQ